MKTLISNKYLEETTKMAAEILLTENEEGEKALDIKLAFISMILNIVYVIVIVVIFLLMKYWKKIMFDKFQVSIVVLFNMIFISKYRFLQICYIVQMIRDILMVEANTNKKDDEIFM